MKLRRCIPPRPRCRPPQVPPDQWVPSANEGWRPYLTATPQRDLVLQFRRAYTPDKPFTAVPADLPPEFNLTNLYWRLTGIAKAQLIAQGYGSTEERYKVIMHMQADRQSNFRERCLR
jgi:hypothetical protein